MCLILFSWKQKPGYKLVLAANRDEFYARPTRETEYWEDQPEILAGRDLEAGGTWMGITKEGRFAAITNYRDPGMKKENAPSRGNLTADFLKGNDTPESYLLKIQKTGDAYYGFNLLIGNSDELWYYNNINHEIRQLPPGSYGLSNALLDTSWPKVKLGKDLFGKASESANIEDGTLFDALGNSGKAADNDLPSTGVPYEWEKAISAMFIETETYGTCSSTIVTVDDENRIRFVEKTYPVGNRVEKTKEFEIQLG